MTRLLATSKAEGMIFDVFDFLAISERKRQHIFSYGFTVILKMVSFDYP